MPLQSLIDDALAKTPPGQTVWIALSGGLDSSLLLTLAAEARHRYPRNLYAVHVNHGLQSAAADFELHSRRLCTQLGVPLSVDRVSVAENHESGLEGAAREARYAAFLRHVGTDEALWLAQHRNDQAESFLLAALRGSGTRGLAGMGRVRHWRGRRLMRPLLDVPRSQLEALARQRNISWIEDPTNANTVQDRNFLRQRVLPLLEQRWPTASASLATSARLAGDADDLLDDLAALDLAVAGGDPTCLPVHALLALSGPRLRLLLRYCCQRQGLPTPPAARLATLIEQLTARHDAKVHITWSGAEARRWRGHLYVLETRDSMPEEWRASWNGESRLLTPLGPLCWQLQCRSGDAISLHVSPRLGGERLHLPRRGHRDLKRLLQEQEMPPWRRQDVLVVWHRDTPVAALEPTGAFGVCAEGWQLTPV